MSVTLTPTAGTLPQGTCFTTPQALLDLFAPNLSITLGNYYGQFVISSSEPLEADRDKVWLKTNAGNGQPIGFFLYVSGAWARIDDPNVWVGTCGGAADAYTLTVSDYVSTTSPRTNDVFIVRIPTASANTGACTLNLNALGVKSIKVGGSDPWAGALEALKWYTLVYDGTNYEATEIKQLTVAALPAGTNGDFLRTRGGASTFESPYAGSAQSLPSAGGNVTWNHGLTSVPIQYEVRFRCNTAEFGYSQDDEVDSMSVFSSNASNENWFGTWATNTVVGIVRNNTADPLLILNKSTGAETALTEGNWRVVCYAIR